MRCSNCGFENEAGAGSCLNCGAALGAPAIDARPPRPVVARPRETQPIQPIQAASPDPAAAAPPTATQSSSDEALAADAPPQPVYPHASQQPFEIQGTTYQTPAPEPQTVGDSFIAGGGGGGGQASSWLLPLIALLLGVVIGALLTYLVIPATEYVVLDPSAEPSPTPTEASVAGVVLIPVPRGKAGPIIPPGPDYQTQVDLRNGLIAVKRFYIANGKYTQETEEMAKIAPEVSWEPGITPSRPGVVAIKMCGPDEASTAVMLQAVSPTGRYFGVFDQPSGPAAGVYYAMGQASFQCPNAMPPAAPWQRGLAGWGISEPTVQASPTPTMRDDRNDPVPDYAPPSTNQPVTSPTPTATRYPTNPGSSPLSNGQP
ncbi:MAG: hypothetical protein DCC49_12670 [Acidobacteria bacterium]|nr:MAG: hypothetical protein DCC49_12670 [Acidobacteriota bacterium]